MVGGPSRGTRFRPLSLVYPKPLFPIAGKSMLEHHVRALVKNSGSYASSLLEILVMGFYPLADMSQPLHELSARYGVKIR